jgi:hypothetical protein
VAPRRGRGDRDRRCPRAGQARDLQPRRRRPRSDPRMAPYLAAVVGAPKPFRVPVWLGRTLAGEAAVRWMTDGRGSSYTKAKAEFGWQPTRSTWRGGFLELAPAPRGVPASALRWPRDNRLRGAPPAPVLDR